MRSSPPTTSFWERDTSITGATFTGLLTDRARLAWQCASRFPRVSEDSKSGVQAGRYIATVPDAERTDPANSPSDVEFTGSATPRAAISTFTMTDIGAFNALNTVEPAASIPNRSQTTGGDGRQIAGEEVQFKVTFGNHAHLPVDHYFFVSGRG